MLADEIGGRGHRGGGAADKRSAENVSRSPRSVGLGRRNRSRWRRGRRRDAAGRPPSRNRQRTRAIGLARTQGRGQCRVGGDGARDGDAEQPASGASGGDLGTARNPPSLRRLFVQSGERRIGATRRPSASMAGDDCGRPLISAASAAAGRVETRRRWRGSRSRRATGAHIGAGPDRGCEVSSWPRWHRPRRRHERTRLLATSRSRPRRGAPRRRRAAEWRVPAQWDRRPSSAAWTSRQEGRGRRGKRADAFGQRSDQQGASSRRARQLGSAARPPRGRALVMAASSAAALSSMTPVDRAKAVLRAM